MKILSTICILALLMFCTGLQAQQNNSDSTTSDSIQRITEIYISHQEEQQKVDSILSTQLQKELQLTENNTREKKALEQKLQALTLADSLRRAEQLQRIQALRKNAKGYAVTLLSDTLFYVYTRIGSFSAAERATAISQRIKKLYDNAFFRADSFSIQKNESTYDLLYNNDLDIMSVSSLDALWYNKQPDALARQYLNIIKKAVLNEKKNNSLFNWLKRIGFIILIIVGIWLIIHTLNRLFNKATVYLKANNSRFFKGLNIKKVTILSAEQHYTFALKANNLLRIVIIILALYLALPLLFSIFPQTKSFADVLIGWITTPAKAIVSRIIKFLPNLFTIAIIYIATRYLVKLVYYFASEIDKGNMTIKGFYQDWAWSTFNVVRFLIYAFMFILIFPYLPGSGSPAFQGVTVFLGVLVSLGSSSAIANLVSGLVITYMRPFKINDRVKIGEVTGDVIQKTMLATRIRTIKNEDIIIPNSAVLSGHTINYSANAADVGLILHTTVTIGYDVIWKDMHQALIDAALKTDFVEKQPLPFVLQTSLDDFYVSYQVNAYTKEAAKQAVIYSDLHKNIQDVCNERGIEIMSPHYNAMRDGNLTTIPAEYLKPGYKQPSFSVKMEKGEPGATDKV